MQLRAYCQAIYNDWIALMSGAASVTLAFSASYSGYFVAHAKAVLWIAAGLCFIVTSYRVWAIERIKNKALETRLTPSLDVLFDFVQVREFPEHSATVTYHGIQVHNAGGATAHRIRVEVEGFREPKGLFTKLSFWQPNVHQPELSLDPEEKKGIFLVKAELKKDVRVILPDVPLKTGRHDLIIRVFARDLPAREAKATLEVTDQGVATLTPV